jgi:pimeloyl-ACP methyl ester carboxylesterase
MADFAGFLPVENGSLYVEVHGSGPPLLLIHGFTLDGRMWDDQVPVFATSRRVVVPDLRGYGRSTLPSPARSYSHVDDLLTVLDALEIDRTDIVGLSMGGRTALELALTAPERVGRQALVDSALRGHGFGARYTAVLEGCAPLARSSGLVAARELWVNDPLFAGSAELPEVARRLRTMVEDWSGWHWLNDDTERWPLPAAVERLESVATPTLVMTGKQDLEDFQAIADLMARRIPGAQQITLEDAGHMANMDDPEAFNAALARFLD